MWADSMGRIRDRLCRLQVICNLNQSVSLPREARYLEALCLSWPGGLQLARDPAAPRQGLVNSWGAESVESWIGSSTIKSVTHRSGTVGVSRM